MYLYNGIEAPELPKSTLPYAHIEKGILGNLEPTLHFTAEKIRVDNTKTFGRVKAGTQNEYYKIVDGKWEYSGSANYEETDGADGDCTISKPKWANHDVFQLNGTLYLAASDPIPVSSAPDIEPLPFTEGLRIGQIVMGMRK
jgi:hypothetical protein